MAPVRSIFRKIIIAYFAFLASSACAQQDLFDRDGAVFSALVVSLTYLGAAQGIIENCGADVEPGARKMIELYELVAAKRGEEMANLVGGLFATGMAMTKNAICDVDNLRAYESWANTYIDALRIELLR